MTETYTVRTTEGYTFEIERYTREDRDKLRERIKLGNDKLNEAFEQLKEIASDTQDWQAGFEKWHEANEKLHFYCQQLIQLGWEDCLYIENGKKTRSCLEGLGCRVCPSRRAYWEEELMDLPGRKVKEKIDPFTKKLAGKE